MGRQPDRSSPAGRKSWKQPATSSAKPGTPSKSSKSVGRWFLTALLLALLAGFVYWVWPDFRGQRHFVITSLWATDHLVVPPISYAREDIDALLKTPDVQAFDATSEGQDTAGLDDLLDKAANRIRRPNDALMLYLAAHGMADDSGAYLICSDFDASNLGRYPVQKLLEKISKAQARLKLIILDVGRINYDPRLGIMGNEFAPLLISAVQKHADNNLWVLLAAGPAQGIAITHSDRQSVFGRAVAQALVGEATRTESGYGDRYVDLREFTQYVEKECRRWFGAELPDFQSPVLVRGGQGIVAQDAIPNDEHHRLVFVKPAAAPAPESTKEPTKDKPAAEPTDKDGKESPDKKTVNRSLPGVPSAGIALLQAPAPQTTAKGTEAPKGAAENPAQPAPAAGQPDSAQKPADKTATDKDKAPDKAGDAKKEASKDSPPQPAAPASPATGSEKATPKAETTATPEQQIRTELQRLWELRDQLRDRKAGDAMTPVDFAPHIWREVEAWLLYYEQRVRAGRVVNSPASGDDRDRQEVELRLRDMQKLSQELSRVAAAMKGEAVAASRDQKSVGDRLLAAWQRYVKERGPADRKFEQEADEILRDARQSARLLADQLHNAAYFVRWYGLSALTLADPTRYRETIGSYLDDLAAATREFRDLEKAPLPSSEQSRLRAFVTHQQQLSNRERELDGELSALEKLVLEKIDNHVAQLRADQLLATPWLPAPRRLKLLEALLKPTPARRATEDSSFPIARNSESSPFLSLRRAGLQLEAKLIQIADADTARRIATAAQNAGANESEEVESSRLRQGVRDVMTYYSALPRALTSDYSLFLVDPRDASEVDASAFMFPTFDVELERTSELQVVPLAKVLQLQQGQPATMTVTLRATRQNLLDARVTPANTEQLLTFDLEDEKELPPERGWYAKTMRWRVNAKPSAISETKSTTSVTVTAVGVGGIKGNATITVDLPQPNRVDVAFTRLGSATPGDVVQGDLRLSLFSNRRTRFQCALINQHDQPKTVNVSLYAVSPRPNALVPIGKFDQTMRRIVYDATSRVFLNAKLVAKSDKPVELPAADPNNPVKQRVLFNFVDPNAAPAAAPAAGAAAAPSPAPQPSPEPIHGLVLEIVDAKDSSQVFPLKWIELEPLAPRDFLNIEVGYDQRRQQIVARLRPKVSDAQGQPDLPPGKPILVSWDASDAKLPQEGAKNLEGEIDGASPQPEAMLAAGAPADGQERIVKIGVDGYPRAFWYSVSCRRDPAKGDFIPSLNDLERETTSIKIESVTVAAQNRVYHFLPDFQLPPPPADDKAPKVEHLFRNPRQPALFRAPAENLIVNLQADAPLDAFRTENDRVQVTLRERNSLQVISRVVRADRDFKAFYVAAGPRGTLELESKVGDLSILIPAGRLENADPVVDAEIRFGATTDSDAVLVQLDGDEPRIDELRLPTQFPKDGKVAARVFVADFEGVSSVIYGFSKDGSAKLADADAKSSAVTTPRLDENQRHMVDFNIDLKDQPVGKRLLLVKVVDHVGHESQLLNRMIVITDPKAMPEKGEIRGVIKYGPAKVNGSRFKMTIEGGDLGPTPVSIQPDGSFVIPDLPIAEYTLKILEGQFSGKSVPPKEQKGIKPVDPKKPQPITLDASG